MIASMPRERDGLRRLQAGAQAGPTRGVSAPPAAMPGLSLVHHAATPEGAPHAARGHGALA